MLNSSFQKNPLYFFDPHCEHCKDLQNYYEQNRKAGGPLTIRLVKEQAQSWHPGLWETSRTVLLTFFTCPAYAVL